MFGNKLLYIAKKLGVEKDDYGNEIPYYELPIQEHCFSYMPTAGQVDYQIYGSQISNMFTSYLPMCYLGKINSGDVAYMIDGEIQNIRELKEQDEINNDIHCQNANYRVRTVQPQNVRVKIVFEKIKQY